MGGTHTSNFEISQPGELEASYADEQSAMKMIKGGYEAMVNEIIQPTRHFYLERDLGPTEFTLCGTNFQRVDSKVTNRKGLILQCSQWSPVKASKVRQTKLKAVFNSLNYSTAVTALPYLSARFFPEPS